MSEKMDNVVSMEEVKVEQKEEKNNSNYTHTSSEPIEIMGKKYTKMTFYFDNMTGEDIEAIETEMQAYNQYVLTPETSSMFCRMLAARAAGIPTDELKRLKAGDYLKIKNAARDFLVQEGY